MRDVDVLIVGGGPAGISTALHLQVADPRVSVVVLERETYPREKICAGGVGGRAFKLLAKIGVEVDCPRVPLNALAVVLEHDTIITPMPDLGAVVRRVEFDHALAKVAIARGIEVKDGTSVERVAVTESGVVVTTAGGEEYRAKVLVGADGVSGVVRKQLGFARPSLRAQVVELDTENLPDDQPRDTVVFDFARRDLNGYAWDFPTQVNGESLVCRGTYVIRTLGPDAARARCAQYLETRGLDIKNYRIKQFAEQGFTKGEPIAQPRVILVGEAAGIDIATGEGIGQAIEYGAVAGPYLARAIERDDLRFADWAKVIDKHHLGFQMRIRHAAYRWFYGPKRTNVERVMPKLPSMFRVAMQDFAGVPIDKLSLMRGAGQLLRAYTAEKFRRD